MTASPTLALGMTAAPSVSMTPAPTVVGQTLPPGVTLAPGTTMAPAIGSIDTPSPVVGGETTANSAHGEGCVPLEGESWSERVAKWFLASAF